jgi:DNA-binding CsgD family transcriptional regulator/KaiC/GvpD/RAD55 family RecA-like ATPase
MHGYSPLVLIGREEQLGRIDRLLDGARLGRSAAFVLHGDPGVGKTALVEHAMASADGFVVLHVLGVEAESDVAFSGLDALLRPVIEFLDAIPATQSFALRGALGLEETDSDSLAAYAGTLSLLAAAAERRPVLVVVDDAHWLDRASADALTFTARRVAGEGIALIFATRTDAGQRFIASGLDVIEVHSLASRDALALLRARWGDELGPGVARHLADATGGNPLALLQIPGLLSDRQRAGLDPLDDPLPITDSIEQIVRGRMRALSPETRRELLLVAAAAPPGLLSAGARDAAEEVGLLHVRDGNVRFEHPLVRAAVYRSATLAERRSAHHEIAEALSAPDDADRRAWHLAAGANGPDEAVATALEAAAGRAQARAGFAAQTQALVRAAQLSEGDESRARRLLSAATAAYWAGDSALAMNLAEQTLPLATEPLLHAAVVHRLAIIADWHGQWRDRIVSSEVLELEAARIEPSDPPRAVGLLGVILQRRFQALETREALDLAERRLAICEPLGGERHLRALQDLARATGLRGDAERCSRLCDEILHRESSNPSLGFATNIAEPLLWLERYDACRRLLSASIQEARSQGNIVRLMFELTNLALLDLRTGNFTRATAAASEVADLARETDNDYLLACNLAVLARLAGSRGDVVTSVDHARRAREIADRLADRLIGAEVAMGLAESSLAEGRPANAIAHLEDLRRLADENEVDEPSVLPFHADLVEAYARTGRESDARAELGRLERQAEATGRRWALAAAARCRGYLGPADALDAHFGQALALHEAAGWSPFQRARTQLLYGERLRRARRRVDARRQLRAAIETFDQLGAARWSERARAELEATGETIARRDETAPEKLTPQELQIALQVAEGRRNREVAEALFLSPKTVEFHLTRVYRKLDLNSRAELIRLLARDAVV